MTSAQRSLGATLAACGLFLTMASPAGAASHTSAAPLAAEASQRTAGNPQIDCRGWVRPGPHTVKDAKPIYSITGGEWGSEVDVTLWTGMGPEGFRHYWSTLAGKTRRGDAVWMDVLIRGAGWHQCGPFGVGSNNQEISSPMGRVTHFSAFRACGRHNNSSGCTSDYYVCCSRHTRHRLHQTPPQQKATPPRA